MAYLVAIPLMLVAAAFGGSLLAKHSLAPVAEMSRHAARISAANLDDRLPVANSRDELGQLGTVLNALLARVHTAFIQQRRFMADASHELRTPVSIIRAESEVALGSDIRSPKEYRESLGVVRDASARLSLIVNELFLLARADAGEQPFTFSTLYLDELVDDCARSVRALAVRSHVDLHVVTHDVDVAFEGDDEMLRRLVTNLLENAVKYSREGAEVTITLSKAPGGYRLSVRDTGEGIAPEAQPHVFERFFRADTARSHQLHGAQSSGSGAGLGLAIARWIAEAHGGTLNLVASSPAGSEFVLWLPASPAGEEPATNQKD
jgi:signal transduction histidine kinase